MSGRRIWIGRFLLVAVSVAITLVFGELVVGIVAPQNLSIWDNTRDGLTVHQIHADVYLPRFDQQIQTNNLGMRDEERSREKADETFRVLILGDSFMEALQVSYEESFPALLERELASEGKSVEVINLAVSGWGTEDQVTYLERYGLELAPDAVLIMMTLHNDIADNSELKFHSLNASGLVTRPVELMPWPRYIAQKIKAYLAGNSQLYQLAYQTSKRTTVRRDALRLQRHVASLLRRDASPDLERNWAVTLALLGKAAGLIESHGARVVVGMIPLRVQIDDVAFQELIETHGLTEDEMDRVGPQRRVAAWAKNRGIPLIDLLPAFSARAAESDEVLYLPTDGHWSAAGHVLAVDQVGREFLRANHDRPVGRLGAAAVGDWDSN